MPFVSTQVVGLIEMDADRSSASGPALAPPRRVHSAPRWNQPQAAHRDEAVTADLDQLDDDLHVELARIVSRIARHRAG